MRTVGLVIISLFLLVSCYSSGDDNDNLQYTNLNSVEKDLRPYNLPFSIRFPIEDEVVGSFKIQVHNELDGFMWYLKKGDDFQFQIEELGDDVQLYEDKVNKLLSIDYFAKNVVINNPNYMVFRLNPKQENERYVILHKFEVDGINFMISTLEKGVKPIYYSRMLKTILSVH